MTGPHKTTSDKEEYDIHSSRFGKNRCTDSSPVRLKQLLEFSIFQDNSFDDISGKHVHFQNFMDAFDELPKMVCLVMASRA